MDTTVTTEADFRAWYERTSPRVYAYVRRYCRDADCDDLPSDSVPWLIGTARNVLANSWRAPSKRQRLTAELGTLTTLAAPDLAGQAVERTDLLRALIRLSQPDQEVLLLAGWDGLDSAGLATALGCSVAAPGPG